MTCGYLISYFTTYVLYIRVLLYCRIYGGPPNSDDPEIPHYFSGEEEDEGENGGGEDSSSSHGQLKGHLNGLYRGFTSIIQTTAQIDPDKTRVPFEVEKAMHNIMFIKHHMKRQDEFDAVNSNVDLAKC